MGARASAWAALAGAIVVMFVKQAAAAPAELGLDVSVVNPRVIQGANAQIEANVGNVASPGNDAMNYSLQFTYPYGAATPINDSLPANNGTVQNTHAGTYNSTGQPFGVNLISVTATAPGAIGSPKTVEKNVTVLSPARPFLWWAWQLVSKYHALGGAQEPSVDPLAFGATGGGESFAAVSMAIGNDPPIPTAHLDLDSISSTGSPQITTDLMTFKNLEFNDDPAFGHAFNVFIDRSTPGNYSKTFTLKFSDEDIPGARGFDSIVTSFTINATITPEPGAAVLAVLLVTPALLARARRSRLA